MQPAEVLLVALRKWVEVFMGHSMHNMMVYSKGVGLSMAQLGALMRIRRQGTLAVSEIGQEIGVTNAAASQLLERLVQQGVVSRSEDPHDRRVKQIGLTPKGQKILEAGLEARQAWLKDVADTLTPAEQTQVAAALQLLTEKAAQLEALPPPHP